LTIDKNAVPCVQCLRVAVWRSGRPITRLNDRLLGCVTVRGFQSFSHHPGQFSAAMPSSVDKMSTDESW